jgi:ABC-type uncharacterized transport system ATPase subunit
MNRVGAPSTTVAVDRRDPPGSESRGSAVQMVGISKRFGNVRSLCEVDFNAGRGEVHALLGQNGAGKTTLMNILCGLYSRDSGRILLGEQEVDIRNPRDAIDHGVGMVHQHPELVTAFTGFENIVLSTERRIWSADWNLHRERIAALRERYGFKLDLDRTVGELPLGHQQKIEILRLLYAGARVLVLDEPTTHLATDEIDVLFGAIDQLSGSGVAVIIVVHKLREALTVAHRITVLSQGRNAGSVRSADTNQDQLLQMVMGGAKEPASSNAPGVSGQAATTADETDRREREDDHRSLCMRSVRANGHPSLDVSLEVNSGEIVGVAGIAGNGQELLVDVLAGLCAVGEGAIELGAQDITSLPPWKRIAVGLGVVPADRMREGILPAAPVYESFALGLHTLQRRWVWHRRAVRRWAREQIDQFSIATASETAPTALMSGGNIQRLLIARAMAIASRTPTGVLVCVNPTHGLDVGATTFVHRQLLEMREAQLAALVISEDLDELMNLSDRILVMRGGCIAGEYLRSAFDRRSIGLDMVGTKEG